jgi:hypothetical protein
MITVELKEEIQNLEASIVKSHSIVQVFLFMEITQVN